MSFYRKFVKPIEFIKNLFVRFYTILQNKRMRRCGVLPTNNFRMTQATPNKLHIVGKGIYPRVQIIKNIGKIFLFRDFMSNFREVVGI